ncbi:MAG: hypothetical protein GX351_00965 [Peptococcaceae bacterium]|jgi:sensor histidine kinase regulating citrate/malate metabolism|nr:hypothetical protein [Peptococcaceae bacterium]
MHSGRRKIFVISVIILFCFLIVMGLGNYRAEQLAVNLTGETVTRAVNIAKESLDKQKLQELITTLDPEHPYYNELRQQLTKIKTDHNLEDLYIIYKDLQEVNWVHIIDVRDLNDPKHKALGERLKSGSVGAERAIRGKAADGLYQGNYVSSYLGIENTAGETIAVIAGDFNAQSMTKFLYTTRYVQFGVIAVSLLLLGLTLFIFRRDKVG